MCDVISETKKVRNVEVCQTVFHIFSLTAIKSDCGIPFIYAVIRHLCAWHLLPLAANRLTGSAWLLLGHSSESQLAPIKTKYSVALGILLFGWEHPVIVFIILAQELCLIYNCYSFFVILWLFTLLNIFTNEYISYTFFQIIIQNTNNRWH